MRLINVSLCLFIIFCAIYLKANAEEDEIGITKLGKTGPTLKFLYCYSCGYKKAFEDYVNILHQKYPELQVNGENYTPPGYNMLIAKVLAATKLMLIILILCGVNVFQWIGEPIPIIWGWCISNKIYSCILIFCLCNAFEGQLLSTGAFEIHFNDVPVWSKLETGRIPQPQELFPIIDTHLQMQFPEIDVGDISFNKDTCGIRICCIVVDMSSCQWCDTFNRIIREQQISYQ